MTVVRTTISLDADIYEAAKALADASGQNLGVVVSSLVRKGLKGQEAFGERNGLPVFMVPSDAPVIPSGLGGKPTGEDDR